MTIMVYSKNCFLFVIYHSKTIMNYKFISKYLTFRNPKIINEIFL